MTPGELVKVIAKVLGMPEATVVVHDRNLRDAGLRSMAGRGRGSAHVSSHDVARLLTAILGSAEVRDSAKTVSRYGETRPQAKMSSKKLFGAIGIEELANLPNDHSFVDALQTLVQSAATGSLGAFLTDEAKSARGRKIEVAPLIEIAVMLPATVGDIRIAGVKGGATASVRYALPSPWDGSGKRKPSDKEINAWEARVTAHGSTSDLGQSRWISARTILQVAEALASNRETH